MLCVIGVSLSDLKFQALEPALAFDIIVRSFGISLDPAVVVFRMTCLARSESPRDESGCHIEDAIGGTA